MWGMEHTVLFSLSLFKSLAQRAHLLPARDGAAVTWQRSRARCHLIWLPWLLSCLERAAQTQCGGLLEATGRNAAGWGWPCSSEGVVGHVVSGRLSTQVQKGPGKRTPLTAPASLLRVSCVSRPRHQGPDASCCFTRMTLRVHLGVSPAYVHRTALWDTDGRSSSGRGLCSEVLQCGRCSLASVGLIRLSPKPRGAPWGSRQRWANTPARPHLAAE